MVMARKNLRHFVQKMLRWFAKHQRSLPWRKTRNSYRVWVSEVMAQQTQIERVLPKYRAFIRQFPTVQDLAHARQTDVVKSWSGLGYNRRAVLMHRAAQMVVQKWDGKFPQTLDELKQLPGVGEYIARAILSFAYHQPVMLIDTNHRRVMQRIFFGQPKHADRESIQKMDTRVMKQLDKVSEELSSKEDGHWRFNQALMDFGAMQCTSASPKCSSCPMRTICVAGPQLLAGTRETRNVVKSSQGTFVGSNRWYRGKVVRLLQGQQRMMISRIAKELDLDEQKTHGIIESLVRDGLLTKSKHYCSLK